MRRRRTDPLLQKLRQLARNGRRAEALRMLQETLRQQPNHAQAREELSRHLTGKPYTFEEKAYDELQELLSSYLSTPTMLVEAHTGKLRQWRKRLHFLQRELLHILNTAEKKTIRQLNQGITRELKRRSKGIGKPLLICAAAASLLLLIGGTLYYLSNRAEKAAQVLRQACHSEQTSIATASQLLSLHDTGLNRTLNRAVGAEAERLRAHIRAAHARSRELDSLLRTIESGQQSVVGQGVRRRAEIERMLRLPCDRISELKQRWAALCDAESQALNEQRLALAEELMAVLPEQEAFSGNIAADAAMLENRCKLLQKRLNIFDDAGEALGLPDDLMIPVRQELEETRLLHQEVKTLRNRLELLPSAHDYDTYRQMLAQLQAKQYAPGVELLEICQQIPAETTLQGMMQEHGQNLRPGLLQASRKSLLEGGPSFSKDFPASREQLHLLEELLSNSALRTRLYELTDTAGEQLAYSEQLPELRHGRACFERSALDPQRDVHRNKAEEWHNPEAILSREIDPRPLHKELGLENRSGFMSTVNLPTLITGVFRLERAQLPALTRAYVLHHLLQANAAATEPILNGLRYAPEMRQVIKEFEALRQSCGIELNGNCWLQNSPRHTIAERKFARWFSKHRRCDFKDEIKRNLELLFRVAPRFCGYVNEQSEPVLFEKARAGQLIWYVGDEGAMTTTPWGSPLQHPRRLSPIFTMEKQF